MLLLHARTSKRIVLLLRLLFTDGNVLSLPGSVSIGPFMGHYFLILVDAYSRWIEVHQVPSITTETTVKTLRLILSIHGLPIQLVSDNGPAFTSHDFKEFVNCNGILSQPHCTLPS